MSLLYKTMSSKMKFNNSNLEMDPEYIDFGIPEMNELFQKLDKDNQNKIKSYNDINIQRKILSDMLDVDLKLFYSSLNEKTKEKIEKLPLHEKYGFIRKLMDEKFDKESVNNVNKRSTPPPNTPPPDTPPPEIFEEEIVAVSKEKVKLPPQERFNELVKLFYSSSSYVNMTTNKMNELEVRFGTKGIKSINKSDYDNVVKNLKSFGFSVVGEETGEYYLRINSEFLDKETGRFKLSNVRVEIKDITNIQEYCKTNEIKGLPFQRLVDFITKKQAKINGMSIQNVDFDDFNFRVSLSTEERVDKLTFKNFMMDNWKKSKKEFRFINRVTFKHVDYPFVVDLSIVKFGNRSPDRFGNANRGPIIRVYTLEESNVLNNPELYEIEIELVNSEIGPGTRFNSPNIILEALRKVIKYVLGGLQRTKFPISYTEQNTVLENYMKIIWKDDYNPNKWINSKFFIGPNSITLQLINIIPIDENSVQPNIRNNFVVTDKADGERHLLFINENGKIYLINTNMDVIFTGSKTNNKECFNTLIDGELILHDKNGNYINLFAGFDIYYINKMDIRNLTFMPLKDEIDLSKSRYNLLKNLVSMLNPVSIIAPDTKKTSNISLLEKYNNSDTYKSPIWITTKEFFPMNPKETIFNACDFILKKQNDGRFIYNTDGLIFTHAFYGVGSDEIGKAGPKTKITWEQSFKWKPPYYNTIDFLVTTEKTANGEDVIKPIFEDGINTSESVQYNEYKQIVLRCGFSEKNDGFINPCQDIIDDKLPKFFEREDKIESDYSPKRFYPTDPYDVNAGLCKIMLKPDESGNKQMYSEENEVFGDNTIVEFRYDFEKEEGWRWVPLRVRYDKTSKLLRGEPEYGNSYKTCNENWKSIHPVGRIEEDMLRTGMNIPELSVCEDKYYNTPAGKFKTQAMKNFHNLYVKKLLIKGVSKPGDTLIDLACGKAGDLPKWIASKLSFVFGIDLSEDNLENRLDGACARYLSARKINKNMPYALFVNGNSGLNIKSGEAMRNDKARQITAAIFGMGPSEPSKIGKGVARQYGKHENGFNITSCQFAMHYFFETPETLQGFLKNLAECTKLNGYFIGTAYDGKLIFDLLKKTKTGESIKIVEDGKKIWEIVKGYSANTFDDDSSSINYRIDVYQESINQLISEYLINFDYFDRVMSSYGFKVISNEEAKQFGFPEGSGLFSELFTNMIEEISKNKFKAKDYGKATEMTSYEKKISFLNRYFIYKKVTEVNVNKVVIELSEYQETEIMRNAMDTKRSVEVAKEENLKLKPKVRKLEKKLLLVPATEAVDEKISPSVVEKVIKKKREKKEKEEKKEEKPKKTKKVKLVIESDSD